MGVRGVELFSVTSVVAALIALCEAKSAPEFLPSPLMQSHVDKGYPPHIINQRSEERFMPQNYLGLYTLPNYNHEFADLPQPSYDQKMIKQHGYPKYNMKSKKQNLEPKHDYGSKKQYPWPKYEVEVPPQFAPQMFGRGYNEEPRRYRSPVFELEHRNKQRQPHPYYHNGFGRHVPQEPVRENVNIFITPPSKRRNKKARALVLSSEEDYGNAKKHRGQCGWRGKHRSPTPRYEDSLEQPILVDYDPSAERRLQLYRRDLYDSSSSEEVVPYASHKWLYPKRSPQHPEEFFPSQKKTNDSSTVNSSATSDEKDHDQSNSSEDTLTFIRRVLATQRESSSPPRDQKDKDKPQIQIPARTHPDFSMLAEGLLSGYAGGMYSNGFFEGKPGVKHVMLNETYTEDESSSSSDSSTSLSS